MSIDWFKFLRPAKVDLKTNRYFQIRQDQFFLDPAKHEHYLKHGWCKLEGVIQQQEIDSFMKPTKISID